MRGVVRFNDRIIVLPHSPVKIAICIGLPSGSGGFPNVDFRDSLVKASLWALLPLASNKLRGGGHFPGRLKSSLTYSSTPTGLITSK